MSSERDRLEFEAGLAEEVDAWLRGDISRRTFLDRLARLGGWAAVGGPLGALAGGGSRSALAAEGGVDLDTLDSPLGQAQAAAV
jgi:multiple sugar transport system substrate-binding protein